MITREQIERCKKEVQDNGTSVFRGYFKPESYADKGTRLKLTQRLKHRLKNNDLKIKSSSSEQVTHEDYGEVIQTTYILVRK